MPNEIIKILETMRQWTGSNINFDEYLSFTRLRSRRVVMCLVVVYIRSTWNIKRTKYREGAALYYIELRPRTNF